MKNLFEEISNENPFLNYSEIVYKLLYNDIVELKIKPGATLSETKISNDLNISRTPVNSAISKLIDKGLAEKIDNKKFPVVSRLNREHLTSYYEARLSIEPFCAKIAAKIFSKDQKKKLLTLTNNISKVNKRNLNLEKSLHDYINSEINFHRYIVDQTNNLYIIKMYSSIYDIGVRYRFYMLNYLQKNTEFNIQKFLTQSEEAHLSIYRAIYLSFGDIAFNQMIEDINRMIPLINDSKFYSYYLNK